MSEQNKIQNKMVGAVKWSFLGECAAKLITPVTNMALARILEPQHFGVLSIVTMVISFADIFSDAGFQKYLVQQFFKTDKELYEYASVAFWTNLFITTIIWVIIFVTAVPLADMLNKPGYQWVIRVGTLKLFLTTFTSVQRAIYQRSFDYKTIFVVRILVALIPIVITIPLALAGFTYWALIIGLLASEFVYAVLLAIKSKWKPRLYYSFSKLKKMFSFSIWSLIEQFTIWLSSYIDTFILSVFLTDYVLGLYKQPKSILSSFFDVFSASIVGVLFSALSRYNDSKDESNFWNLVQKTQIMAALIIFPCSVGIFVYKELAVTILLGEQWKESAIVMGCSALSFGIAKVMNSIPSEVYRAKGEPWVSVIAQMLYVGCLVPLCVYGVQQDFRTFVIISSARSVVFMLIHYLIMKVRYNINIRNVINTIKYPLFSAIIMGIIVTKIKSFSTEPIWDVVGIGSGVLIYIILISYFKTTREVIKVFINKLPNMKIFLIIKKIYRV